MSIEISDDEYILFRPLTAEEILKTKNQQTILTPKEKFDRIQKAQDKKARRLRKFHFVAIETTKLLYVFDGDGIEICQVENSVKGCRLARVICFQIFDSAPRELQGGGYYFTGPNYENLTEEEYEQHVLATYKNIEYHSFTQKEIDSGEYEPEKKNYCYECKTQFADKVKLNQHLCTEFWLIKEFKFRV